MLRTKPGLRLLGPPDVPAVLELLSRDPVANVFVEHRVRQTRLEPRWLGGEVWGVVQGDRLVSLCHAGANLVPVEADDEALRAYARRALALGRGCSSIVGPSAMVDPMWQLLAPQWGPARSLRRHQPYLRIERPPLIAPDPDVRRAREDELDILYPASVAMFTEEVGVSPEVGEGDGLYRARVLQLIRRGLTFARIEHGQVVFKAEIGSVTPSACQVQGVWVQPRLRGRGLASAAMAAVVEMALRDIAPVVALCVNEHNERARRVYERVGFVDHDTFTTVLF
jgi:hypothetical protein